MGMQQKSGALRGQTARGKKRRKGKLGGILEQVRVEALR